MTESKPKVATPEEVEAAFRSSLGDVAAIAEKLAPHCRTVEEMVGMIQLAIDNDGQLRLLMDTVTAPKRAK